MAISNNLTNVCDTVRALLLDKKVEDIKEFDLSGNNKKLSDVCFIGSGTSSRHAQSVADYLYKLFKDAFNIIPNMSGEAKSGWIVIEALGVEVHIFKPELRKYYDLEGVLSSTIQEERCVTLK